MDDITELRQREGCIEYVAKQRICLSCGTEFASEWAGNRICKACVEKRNKEESDSYRFDNSVDFVYDMTIQQLLEEVTSTGSLNYNFDEDKGGQT